MIKIRSIDFIPTDVRDCMDTYARYELEIVQEHLDAVLKASRGVWVVYDDAVPLFVIGLIETSVLGTGAEVWFLGCTGAKRCSLRVLRLLEKGTRRMVRKYAGLKVCIEVGFDKGERLVRWLGFRPTLKQDNMFGKDLTVFEKRLSWH